MRSARAPAHNWLTAALAVVAEERPKLEAAVGAEEAQRFVEGVAAELEGMLAALVESLGTYGSIGNAIGNAGLQ